MDLSIVIVTWNNGKEIGPCLRSVFSFAEGLKCEVFVVDNGSSDGTRKVIEETINNVIPSRETRDLNVPNSAPRFLASDKSTITARNDEGIAVNRNIKMIWNDRNLGFAAAVNQGMKESKGEFVLLLNPDTELTPGCMQTMLQYLRQHRGVGVAGGKVLNNDGSLQPSVRRFPTAWDQAVILLKMHNFFPKIVAKYFCEGLNYDVEQEVDQVRGAYFWVSRRLIEKIGVLDAKSFFIWFEEVDYCRRAWDADFKVMYLPSSVALHAGGASFNQEPSFQKQRWLDRSMRNYFRKHGTVLDVIVVTLLIPVSLALAWGVQRFKIKPKKYV